MSRLNILKSKAFELRECGNSYGQIMRTLGLTSKGTLSYWFKNLELSETAKKKLENNMRIATERGLLSFNKKRTEMIVKENETIRTSYLSRIKKINERDLTLLGTALYWGEGQKSFNNQGRRYPYLSFANSDPQMILLFLKFVKEILKTPQNKISAIAMIYPNFSSQKSINYWQTLTGIPIERFRAYKAISRASKGIRPKNLLPYGTLQIRVNRRQEFFKIRGLIDGIIKSL